MIHKNKVKKVCFLLIILILPHLFTGCIFENESKNANTYHVVLDTTLKNTKPGILAEKMMQIIHETSIKKDDNYKEDWTDGKTNKNWENVRGFDQYYYYSIDAEYDAHMDEYTPEILIEGNSKIGCVHIEYTDWTAGGPRTTEENESEIREYVLSIINSLGLYFDSTDKIEITKADNLGLWLISVFQVFNNETLYPMSSSQAEGIDSTIHFGKQVRYFSILDWIDKSKN